MTDRLFTIIAIVGAVFLFADNALIIAMYEYETRGLPVAGASVSIAASALIGPVVVANEWKRNRLATLLIAPLCVLAWPMHALNTYHAWWTHHVNIASAPQWLVVAMPILINLIVPLLLLFIWDGSSATARRAQS